MASIDVETAALHAAARSISGIANTFSPPTDTDVAVSSVQATGAAVRAVHAAASGAESTMAARLRSTASAMAAGGTAFAATEQASADAIAAVAPNRGAEWQP
jgi:hypothetical protein